MTSLLNEDATVATMETVMKNIYTSCDPDNSNLVPVSKIVDFIAPYMLEDLSALENLRSALDPQNNNVCISSEQFYEVMNEWTKTIASSADGDNDFNRTPSQLDVIDEKQLPYTQSTPRASFGQKLLSCEGLLNLSNVSSYSLSTSTQTGDNNTVGVEKTILEEEIKRLEHHLSKLSNEMVMVRLQLTSTEEQNEILQADLDRCKTRLHSEQQVIEHLQNDKRYNDELREELNASKKQIEDLTKKLLQYEKDNHHLYSLIEQTEKENSNLENRCEELSHREQEAKKEIIDIKTELDLKDQEITTIIKINDEMKIKLNQQKDLIDQLTNENELLNHKKLSLEKVLRENLSSRRDSIVSQYKTCLADSSSFANNLDQSSEEECYFKIQEADSKSFILCDSLQTEISQVSFERDKLRYSGNTDNCPLEYSEKQIPILDNNENLNDNFEIYEKEINQLKVDDDNMRTKLDAINQVNELLQAELWETKNKVLTLEQDIDNLIIEKAQKEECLKQIENEKLELQTELEELKERNSVLKDENGNLIGNNKSLNDSLELKIKLLTNLNENLLALKKEIANLQSDNDSKEKELCEFRNKFDFEVAFKNLQIELNERNIELSELNKSNEELQERLGKVTNSNQELQKSLKETKLKLEEHLEKSRQMLKLNENIEHTTSQVQLCIDEKNSVISELQELNSKFEKNISILQEELQTKFQEVMDLRDSLERDMEIKNIMWRDNKDLSLKLKEQCEVNTKLSKELEGIKNKNEKVEEDYKNLMTVYNKEVDNTKDLSEQLSMQNEKFTTEVETLNASHHKRTEEFRKQLIHYENINRNLEKAKMELDMERKKSKQEKFFDIDITPSDSLKNRSFEKQKMSIDRLKEKLEYATSELKNERHRSEQLRKEILAKNQWEEKFTNMQMEFEKRQVKFVVEKQALQNIISNMSDTIKAREEEYKKLEQLSNEKEHILSSKLSQLEQQNQHLFAELRSKDFLINNIVLENEANKNFLANADRKSQECSTRLSSCILQINERDKRIQLLHSQIAEKDNKVLGLMAHVADLDTQLSKVRKELSEKTSTAVNLQNENKSLQEMLSKSDDHKEKELMDIEQKLKATCRLLQCSEMELSLIQKKVSDVQMESELDAKDTCERRDIVLKARNDLSRVSDLALKRWEGDLEEVTYQNLLKLKQQETSEESDGLLLLNDEIKFTVLLVETLANRAPKAMDDTDCSFNSLVNTENNLPCDTKNIKKFTLRPPRLIVSRPASPDSPSVDIEDGNEDDLNASHMYIRQDSTTCNNEDSFQTASDELSISQGQFELLTEDGFPNISDAFLEKLGLHESSPKQVLSKEETESLFTTFAIQIALDSKDIKERLHNQKDQCAEEYEKFLSILRDISARLRDHNCIGATDSINAVFVLLEDLKFFVKDIMQSVGQFGVLTCENRMMKCWNLVTNYMALLKQEVIKSEMCQAVENRGNVREDESGKHIKKRSKNKVQKQCEKSVTSKHDTKSRWSRFKYGTMGRITVATIVFLIFFILMLVIMIHWQCRMSVSENQVCVLDDFIKKIQVGNPPY